MSKPGFSSSLLAAWNVGSIVAEICQRAGVPLERFDTSLLEGSVDGIAVTANADAYEAIEELGGLFLFDASSYGGEVHFVPRGGNSIATITTDDLVDDGEEIEKVERRDSIDVPRVMLLEYYDTEGGLSPDKQSSDRGLDIRSKGEKKTQTSVVMTTEDAAKAVVISHKIVIEEQRGEYEFSLPSSWLWLACADVITLDGVRLRITEVTIDDGFQTYKAMYDRASAYDSAVTGVPINQPDEPPTLVVEDTVLHFIESPIIRDADDALGYYIAVNGTGDAWRGAVVELSLDGGLTYLESAVATAWADIGELTEPLGYHPHQYPDEINTTTIKMLRPESEISSTDLAGMQNRLNLAMIGNELVNLGTATESAPQHWTVNHLLRGRKGTTPVSHPVGTRVVMMTSDDLYFVPTDLFALGRTLTLRVTSLDADNSLVSSHSFSGVSQTERQPAYLQAIRSGGNLLISWQGVGRLGGGASVAMGSQFAGYQLTIGSTVTTTQDTTATVPDPGGSVTLSVRQINRLTGVGPAITVTI